VKALLAVLLCLFFHRPRFIVENADCVVDAEVWKYIDDVNECVTQAQGSVFYFRSPKNVRSMTAGALGNDRLTFGRSRYDVTRCLAVRLYHPTLPYTLFTNISPLHYFSTRLCLAIRQISRKSMIS
jgi:hypothetical protein